MCKECSVIAAPEVTNTARLCHLTPELSGGAPTHWDIHFIVHRRSNEMLEPTARATQGARLAGTDVWSVPVGATITASAP